MLEHIAWGNNCKNNIKNAHKKIIAKIPIEQGVNEAPQLNAFFHNVENGQTYFQNLAV